jgi:ketosteroid isomerase-like protein
MSQDDLAVVQPAYAGFAVGGVGEFIEHWAADLEHRAVKGAPDDRGPIHGRGALRSYIDDWIDTFDNFKIEIVELVDAGQGKVVAVLRFGGRAKLSGVETDQTFGGVFTIRDGKIARGSEYTNRVEALEAAGLRE